MARGGKRDNAGRKPSPVITLKLGAASSERLLKRLKHEEQTVEIYSKCGDWRLKWQILEDLRDRAFGKPTQPVDHGGSVSSSITIVSKIERPKR